MTREVGPLSALRRAIRWWIARTTAEGAPRSLPLDPVHCACGKTVSVSTIVSHLERDHGIDPREIAHAQIVEVDDDAS